MQQQDTTNWGFFCDALSTLQNKEPWGIYGLELKWSNASEPNITQIFRKVITAGATWCMTQNAWEGNQIPQIVIERNPSWPVVPVVTISIVTIGLVKDAAITAQCGVAHRLLLRYIDTGVRTKYAALATLPTFNGHWPNFISTQNLVPKSHLVFGPLLHILERKMLSAILWELFTNLVCRHSCKRRKN